MLLVGQLPFTAGPHPHPTTSLPHSCRLNALDQVRSCAPRTAELCSRHPGMALPNRPFPRVFLGGRTRLTVSSRMHARPAVQPDARQGLRSRGCQTVSLLRALARALLPGTCCFSVSLLSRRSWRPINRHPALQPRPTPPQEVVYPSPQQRGTLAARGWPAFGILMLAQGY